MSKTLLSLNQLEKSNVGNKTIVTNVFGVPVYVDYNLPFLPLSGGTVSGATIFTGGLTGSSIVANSFNYTWAGPVVGSIFSYFNDTIYSNEDGKTHYFGGGPGNIQNNLSVPNGNLQVSSGLTANIISATTYLNLPSLGGSFTGGTVSGATEFTGGLTANTISATTITSPSISPYGLIVATSIGYQNIF